MADFEAIRAAVREAVRTAGPSINKSKIVARLVGRGAGRSTLFRWVEEEMARKNAAAASAASTATYVPLIIDPAPAPPPVDEPIAYLPLLQMSLRELQGLILVAKQDGKVRNIRLMLHVLDLIGKTLQRAASIQDTIRDQQAQTEFLRAVVRVIREEPPEVRDRLVEKMRALNTSYL